ncbi:MAG: helix-turn-helix domain-containing protein [Saprospiraceae bacterium]|nr:helix-turn-helix domain-containing protein [Saprospiraceae bacterium]
MRQGIHFRKYIFLFVILVLSAVTNIANSQEVQDVGFENLIAKHQWKTIIQKIETEKLLQRYKHNVEKEAYYLYLSSEAQYRQGNFVASKDFLQEALILTPKLQDSTLLYRIYLLKVQTLNNEGQLSELLNYLNNALDYATRQQNQKMLHDCYILLGGQSLQNGKMKEALKMYQTAKNISVKHRFTQFNHLDDTNLAFAYCYLQLDSAKVCLDRAKKSAVEQKDSVFIATIHNVYGFYYLVKNDRKRWKEEVLKSLSIAQSINHLPIISLGFSQLMEYAISDKNYDEAIKMGQKAHQTLNQKDIPLFHSHVDSLLYEAYKAKGDDHTALQYFEKYYRGRTSILSREQADKLEDFKRNFELKEKNLQIKNQALELENTKKRSLALIVANGMLLMLLVGGYFYRKNQKMLQATLYRKEKMTGLLFKQDHTIDGETKEKQIEVRFNALGNGLLPDKNADQYDTKDKRDLYIKMIQAIEEQKLYLNPNLDVNLIVTTLGTNKFYLYQAISKNASENFRNIINRYRVEEAKRLLEKFVDEKSLQNLESIHTEAGFNSPSSYYRIFRHMTGLTPKEYMQEYGRDVRP